jgi:nucleoside-diphosphate-sugar epimerase
MKILVTGGAGFIGSHTVDALLEAGHEVLIIDNLSSGKKSNINAKAHFFNADICDLEKIKPIFKGVKCVFHLAALARIQPSIVDPAQTIKNNVLGTTNVLIAARDAGVKRVIYSASSSSYGDQVFLPLKEDMCGNFKNPYSLSKYVGEELCKIFSNLYNLDTVCLRYFNVYGPRQLITGAYATVIGIFINQIENEIPLTIVGDGSIKRDFTNIADVVRANLLAMKSEKKFKGEIINIGTGVNYSINDVANILFEEKAGISLENALKSNKAIHIDPRPGENKIILADNSKAHFLLGWKPEINFKAGIKQLCNANS